VGGGTEGGLCFWQAGFLLPCLDFRAGQLLSTRPHSYLTDIASVASVKGELKSSPDFFVHRTRRLPAGQGKSSSCRTLSDVTLAVFLTYKMSEISTDIHMFAM
jgi:hypothetical protein